MRPSFRILAVIIALGTIACTFGGWDSMGRDRRRVVLPSAEVHEGWYFASGDQVSILGTINGDAYIAGGVVDVQGTINGQLVVAGGQVTVGGTVTDRIFAGGGSVRVTGKVGKSIVMAGGTVVLGKDATVGDNLLAAGGNVEIDGTVEREARLAGGEIDLTGSVKGNMDVAVDRFHTFKGALVGGNLSITARDTANVGVEPGTVVGSVHMGLSKAEAPTYILGMRSGVFWVQVFLSLTLFATALVLAFLIPGHLTVPGAVLTNQLGQSALWGIIVLILAPIVGVFLCVTVIGIPLGIFFFLLYLWILYVSQMMLGVAIGSRLFGLEGKRGWALFGAVALGLLIVEVLMFVPILRILLVLAGLVLGVGALAIAAKTTLAAMRTRGAVAPGLN